MSSNRVTQYGVGQCLTQITWVIKQRTQWQLWVASFWVVSQWGPIDFSQHYWLLPMLLATLQNLTVSHITEDTIYLSHRTWIYIQLVPPWKLHHYYLARSHGVGKCYANREEKVSQLWTLLTAGPVRYVHLFSNGKKVMGTTNHFLIR